MGKVYYSPSKNSFYPLSMKSDYEASPGGWPTDAFEVDKSVHSTYALEDAQGKYRVAGKDGHPTWGTPPEPEPELLMRAVEIHRNSLMEVANKRITSLVEAQDDGDITDEEMIELTTLRAYRTALRRLDLTQPIWPQSVTLSQPNAEPFFSLQLSFDIFLIAYRSYPL